MQQTVLIAAMIASYVEAGIVFLLSYEPAEDECLPGRPSAGAGGAVHVTANLTVITLWPLLFLTSKVLGLLVRD